MLNVGDRVRVLPSGEAGRIERVTQASDGRTVYEVLFDTTHQRDGESGGLYVAEDLELAVERPARP